MSALGFLYAVACWMFGITSVIFRLGIGLWKREIAIFGSIDFFGCMRDLLLDSKIFKDRNIVHIQSDNLDKAKNKSIFLVDWATSGTDLDKIFGIRRDNQTAVIIYAKPQAIPTEKMPGIADNRNTVVVNFKGRLLNDILTSLITTSYER